MSYTGATAELFELPRVRPAAPRRGLRVAEARHAASGGSGRLTATAGTPAALVPAAGAPAAEPGADPGEGPVGGSRDTSWGGGRPGPEAAPEGLGRLGPSEVGPPPSRAVVQLLEAARDELRAAQDARQPAERFRSAHLGALRAAAAVLALRARARRSSRPTDAWTLLASVAPEYAEWAAFFAAHSATRSAVDAGVRGRVSQRDADDMVRQADLFLALVTRTAAGRAGS